MLTNKKGLPETFVTVLGKEFHQAADYSASQLTKPPRMVHLEKRHRSETVEDVTDHIWRLFGSAVHSILQTGETSNQLVEEYFVEELRGVKISGMSDIWENKKISDYKVTSAWSYVFLKDKMADFTSQLNTYAWLFRKSGIEVEELEIVMILRDWVKSKSFDHNYPDCQVQRIPVTLWPMDIAEAYISSRIDLYERYKDTPDNDLPFCSPADRWAKPSKFAVMGNNRKSAHRLCDTEKEAKEWMESNGKGDYIQERKAEQFKRCEYCSIRNFCNQYVEGQE